MMLTGDIVRLVRSNLKMPQKDFAQKLNISQPYLCRIEYGSRVITPKVEAKIRREFAVDDLIISVLAVAANVINEGGKAKSDLQTH